MASREHFPVVEHGRKHTLGASIVGRRLLKFGDVIPPARYIFSEATTVRVTKGATVTHASLSPTWLPPARGGGGFSRTYHRELDQNLHNIDHSFTGTETLGEVTVNDGLVVMRNEEDMGRAELTISRPGGNRRRITLRQADNRAAIAKAKPVEREETTAAAIMRAILWQHGSSTREDIRALRTVDDLFLQLSAISPAVKIERVGVYDTSAEGSFDFSSIRISEDVRQRQGKAPVTINQVVTCTGLMQYPDHPGIVGSISMSLAAGPKAEQAAAALRASIEIPEDQTLSIPERNRILNETIVPYQTLDGFMGLFVRQLDSI